MELEFATSHRDSFKTGLNRMALRRGRPSWFLPAMAAASCRLRKSGSLKPLIYSDLASNPEDLPVCAVPNSVNARANRPLLLRWGCLFPVLPSTAPPSTQERNDISADVILAKELKRLICRWHAFVKGIDSCSACHHAALISVPTRSA